MASLKNEKGTITIADDVIANIAGTLINDASCYGVVGMASKNTSDSIYEILNMSNLNKGIKVTSKDDDTVDLEMHIVVEYGTPISVVADQAIETMRYNIEQSTGLTVGKVNIVVEGVRV